MDGTVKNAKEILTLQDRKVFSMNTVINVESFDEQGVILSTTSGRVTVEGHDLKIEALSKESGEILIVGAIDGILFSGGEEETSHRFFHRLFK